MYFVCDKEGGSSVHAVVLAGALSGGVHDRLALAPSFLGLGVIDWIETICHSYCSARRSTSSAADQTGILNALLIMRKSAVICLGPVFSSRSKSAKLGPREEYQ
jgi:hypothetical protein